MRARRRIAAIGCVLAVMPALAWQRSTASAQSSAVPSSTQPAPPAHGATPSATPTIKVYTRETVVDVTVTDKNGKPVHGLTRADFIVTEDSKQQSIRSFKEFSKDTPATASTPRESTLRKLPVNTYTNLQTGSGPLNIFLFDDINGGDNGQARLAAAKFIKSMAPGTRVALLALGFSLTVLQGPTTDRDLLLKVINTPVRGLLDPCGEATLDQLREVANYFSETKGRKNLIWLGDGIPRTIFPEFGCPDMTKPLQDTYDLLADSQITVYPLYSDGLIVPTAAPPTDRKGNPVAGAQAAATYVARYTAVAASQLALEAVAEATGGEAFYNTNDISAALNNAIENGSDYYTLSYAPPSVEYDGKYHAISIKVDRPGIHLLYRKGYSAEDPMLLVHPPETLFGHVTRDTRPTGPAADPLAAALSPIAPPATQLLFDVRVEPSLAPENPFDPPVFGVLDPKFQKARLTRYGLLFAVPQSQIAFADAGGGTYSGSLKFDIAAFDSNGNMVTSRSQTMKLPLTNEEYQQFITAPFQLYQQLDLPPGEFTLRVGVLDSISNKLGTVQIPLAVDKKATVAKLKATPVALAPTTTSGDSHEDKDGR